MSSAKQATAGTNEAAVTPRSLWRNLAFQTLWVGTSASTLGVSVADIAYPLAILAITRSPALAGLFAAVQSLGMLAAGLPAGVLADRYDSRTIVIVAEAARAGVTAVVAMALIAGWRSVPLLFTAAALLGAGQAVRSAAGLLLQYLPAQAAMLTLAAAEAAGVAYCSTRRELWQARWPGEPA